MAKGYYPDYYARKRQRDIQLFWTGRIIMIVVLIAVGVFAGVYVWNTFIKQARTEPGVNPGLAEERDQLAAQSRLDEAARPPAGVTDTAADAAALQPPDLATLPYENNFPLVGVSLASGTDEGAVVPGTETPAEAAADGTTPADSAAAQPPTPEVTVEPKPPVVEPKPAKPETAEKPKEQPKAEKPADKPKEKPEAKPEEDNVPEAPATGAKSSQYCVYAGAFTSKDLAEQASGDLSAHGLNGQISYHEPNYIVLVAVLDDYQAALALQRKVVESGFPKAYTTRKSVPK